MREAARDDEAKSAPTAAAADQWGQSDHQRPDPFERLEVFDPNIGDGRPEALDNQVSGANAGTKSLANE